MRRQILTDDNRTVHALRIPYYYQSNSDWLCFVFSLKMCLEYFKNIYRNEFVRNSTPNLSIDELKQLTHSGEFTGTRIDKALMNELTRKIPSINFTLNEECSIDHLKRKFEKQAGALKFNEEQMNWLRMVKEHIATSFHIEVDDLEYTPFDAIGGRGKIFQLFGSEMNVALAAAV